MSGIEKLSANVVTYPQPDRTEAEESLKGSAYNKYINGIEQYLKNVNGAGYIVDPSNKDNQPSLQITSEGQAYYLVLSAHSAMANPSDKKIAAKTQSNFDLILKGTQKMIETGKSFPAWHARFNPATQTVSVVDGNSATDADVDFISSLIYAQSLVESGIWKRGETDYGKLAEDLIKFASQPGKVFDTVAGKLVTRSSAADYETKGQYFTDYLSPATYLDVSKFCKAKGLSEQAKLWEKATDDSMYIYKEIFDATNGLKQSEGGFPGKYSLIENNGKIEVSLGGVDDKFKVQSFDGIRAPWEISKYIQQTGKGTELGKQVLEAAKNKSFKFTNTVADYAMYLPLAEALGERLTSQLLTFNISRCPVEVNRYYQNTLLNIGAMDSFYSRGNFFLTNSTGSPQPTFVQNISQIKIDSFIDKGYNEVKFNTDLAIVSLDGDNEITSAEMVKGLFDALKNNDKGKFEKLFNTIFMLSGENFAFSRISKLIPSRFIVTDTGIKIKDSSSNSKDDALLLVALIGAVEKGWSSGSLMNKIVGKDILRYFVHTYAQEVLKQDIKTTFIRGNNVGVKYLCAESSLASAVDSTKYKVKLDSDTIKAFNVISKYFETPQGTFTYRKDNKEGAEMLYQVYKKVAKDSDSLLSTFKVKSDESGESLVSVSNTGSFIADKVTSAKVALNYNQWFVNNFIPTKRFHFDDINPANNVISYFGSLMSTHWSGPTFNENTMYQLSTPVIRDLTTVDPYTYGQYSQRVSDMTGYKTYMEYSHRMLQARASSDYGEHVGKDNIARMALDKNDSDEFPYISGSNVTAGHTNLISRYFDDLSRMKGASLQDINELINYYISMVENVGDKDNLVLRELYIEKTMLWDILSERERTDIVAISNEFGFNRLTTYMQKVSGRTNSGIDKSMAYGYNPLLLETSDHRIYDSWQTAKDYEKPMLGGLFGFSTKRVNTNDKDFSQAKSIGSDSLHFVVDTQIAKKTIIDIYADANKISNQSEKRQFIISKFKVLFDAAPPKLKGFVLSSMIFSDILDYDSKATVIKGYLDKLDKGEYDNIHLYLTLLQAYQVSIFEEIRNILTLNENGNEGKLKSLLVDFSKLNSMILERVDRNGFDNKDVKEMSELGKLFVNKFNSKNFDYYCSNNMSGFGGLVSQSLSLTYWLSKTIESSVIQGTLA
ncbi:MAG: glycosyl hydrolase family 8 [Candidatus Riflemargulisbacteria bacterium]